MRATLALLIFFFVSGCLSAPVDVDQLDELKDKLKSLHEVLNDLTEKIDNLENQDKREFAPTPPTQPKDEELIDFIDGLDNEDKDIVNKMKSKLKFLQATVHEEPGVDIPAADGYAQEQPLKRNMDEDLQNLYDQLPEEDKKLLKAHPSVWGHLDKALKTPGGGDPADVEVQKKEYEEELQSFVDKLSKDDKDLLNRMKSKLQNLKDALKKENQADEEGTFGEFVDEKHARNVNNGLWQANSGKCEGSDCDQSSTDQVVNEVERRFLDDVRFAKENGVSLKQVLRVLMEAKLKA